MPQFIPKAHIRNITSVEAFDRRDWYEETNCNRLNIKYYIKIDDNNTNTNTGPEQQRQERRHDELCCHRNVKRWWRLSNTKTSFLLLFGMQSTRLQCSPADRSEWRTILPHPQFSLSKIEEELVGWISLLEDTKFGQRSEHGKKKSKPPCNSFRMCYYQSNWCSNACTIRRLSVSFIPHLAKLGTE